MASQREADYLPALRFSSLTPYFDAFVRATTRETRFKRRLLDGLQLAPGARVLDVGAGTGTLAIQIKQRLPDARVTGLDADPQILAIARRKASDARREVDFVEGLSNELPFADESFDAVVSTLFFHHLDRAAKIATLEEVARVLAPRGELRVADWGRPRDPLQAALFLQVRVFDGFGVTADNARGGLAAMFADAGLEGARVEDAIRTAFGTIELLTAGKPAA